MDKLSSDSTVSTSTLCAKDVYSEKDVVFGEVLKDGRRSTEHQIEINGTCVYVDRFVLHMSTLIFKHFPIIPVHLLFIFL